MRYNWDAVTIDDIRLALGDSRVLDIVLETGYLEPYDILEELDLDEIETIASNEGFIDCESKLSELFNDVLEDLDELTRLKLKHDEVMLSEMFDNWVDSMASDGLLHPQQVNNYCYKG